MTASAKPGLRLATVKEACAYGKMGVTKLYQKINAGTVVAYKDGKRTLVDLDSIDATLEPFTPKQNRV
jgi:excisionase family DNA binding protein